MLLAQIIIFTMKIESWSKVRFLFFATLYDYFADHNI